MGAKLPEYGTVKVCPHCGYEWKFFAHKARVVDGMKVEERQCSRCAKKWFEQPLPEMPEPLPPEPEPEAKPAVGSAPSEVVKWEDFGEPKNVAVRAIPILRRATGMQDPTWADVMKVSRQKMRWTRQAGPKFLAKLSVVAKEKGYDWPAKEE